MQNSNKNKVNFALIGCGRIAYRHANILANEMPNARLIAVCDIKKNRAEEFSEKYKTPYYLDYHKMLKTEKQINVVNILTESGNHARHVIDASKYCKNIIVEKPMALSLTGARKMIEACEKNRCRLFVVKQNRYNLPVQKLREAIKQSRFGRLILGTVRVRWCRRQEYYDQDEWRGTKKMDGGVFSNQASHHIDLLQWMMGRVKSVYAKSITALADIETEDTGAVILKFEGGALGIIEATTATRPIDIEGSISVLGERGTVEIGGFAMNEMKVWQFEDMAIGEKEHILSKYKTNPPDVYGFGHKKFLEDVVNNIQNGTDALIDGKEGKKTVELINAIQKSAATGKEIFLS
jgi:UDP-N-acetyl-2-amino-2-deoxyglucuronate dehydrogenase